MKEFNFEVENIDRKTTHIEPNPVPEGKDPVEHFNELLESWNKDYPNDRRKLIKVIGETGVRYCSLEKVNYFTISRGDDIYDLMSCKNCGLVFQRFGLGQNFSNYKICKPHLVCNKCNKIFANSAGLNAHNKRGNHKLPNWYPDGV